MLKLLNVWPNGWIIAHMLPPCCLHEWFVQSQCLFIALSMVTKKVLASYYKLGDSTISENIFFLVLVRNKVFIFYLFPLLLFLLVWKKKYSDEKQPGEERVDFCLQFQIVFHLCRKVTVVKPSDRWSHGIHSQELMPYMLATRCVYFFSSAI